MAEGKKKFLAYSDWEDIFEALPNDKAGELIKHVFKYVNDRDPQTDDVVINVAFAPIKRLLKADLKKWEGRRDTNIENGKKGGRPKKTENNPEKPIGFSDNPQKGVTVNVNDTVTVNVTDNVDSNESKNGEKVFSLEIENFYTQILSFFPEHLHPDTSSKKKNWLDTIDKLERLDKIPLGVIGPIIKWAREDNFWSSNFLALPKLRKTNKDGVKYIQVFAEKMKQSPELKKATQKERVMQMVKDKYA